MDKADTALTLIRRFIQLNFQNEDVKTYLQIFFSTNNYLINTRVLHNAPSYFLHNPEESLLEAIASEIPILERSKSSEEKNAAFLIRRCGYSLTHQKDREKISVLTEKGHYIDCNAAAYGLSLLTFIAAEGVLGREIDEGLKNRINCRILYDRQKFLS